MAGDLKTNKYSKKNGEDIGNYANLDPTATETYNRILQRQGCKDRQHDKGGKAFTQPTKAASARNDHRDDGGGKASTRKGRQSICQTTTNATQTMLMMQAKAGVDAETLQRELATTTSGRPLLAEHPK